MHLSKSSYLRIFLCVCIIADNYFCLADYIAATKLRYFSDHKLGLAVPVRGESSNLLNAEEEKNDYDWFVFNFF